MTYIKGYFKACLDLLNYFEKVYKSQSLSLKTKKRSQNFTLNLIRFLAKNPYERNIFMRYGGDVTLIVNKDTLEIKGLEVQE